MIKFEKQYIGHACHAGDYPPNSLGLYSYMVDKLQYRILEADIVFTKDNIPVLNHSIYALLYRDGKFHNIDITSIDYGQLQTYSLFESKSQSLTTLHDFACFASVKKSWIMLDLTFQKYDAAQMRIIFNILKDIGIIGNTIWAGPRIDLLPLESLKDIIYQFGSCWHPTDFFKVYVIRKKCKHLILSLNFWDAQPLSPFRSKYYSLFIALGHKLGCTMKVATVNTQTKADVFWSLGVDLINTDVLIND